MSSPKDIVRRIGSSSGSPTTGGPLRFRAPNRGRRPGLEEAEADPGRRPGGASCRSPLSLPRLLTTGPGGAGRAASEEGHLCSPSIITSGPGPARACLAPAALAVPALAAATSPAVPASDDKHRRVTVRLSGIPGRDAVISGLVKGHLAVTCEGELLAGTLPAVPASDDPDRRVKVRLTGLPGADVVLSGLVNGRMTIFRAGGVLAVGGVAEEG
ncbi:MAG: hypothetical protein M1826_004876 [Phylliscum demangeonii]|nr:MAG: hypothetical protein M1826_004876 [Phylliscum demangeonii]